MLYLRAVFHSARESALIRGTAKLAIDDGDRTAAAGLTQGMGKVLDLTDRGQGVRSSRYSMIVENGALTQKLEKGEGFEVSHADHFPSQL